MRHIAPLLLALALLTSCARATPAAPTPLPAAPPATAPASPAPTEAPSATPVPPTLTPAVVASPTPAPPRYDLVLRGGQLLDGSGGPPIADAAVAILGGRIAYAGPADGLAFSEDTPLRQLPGATIMPGFVNAHAHSWELRDDQLRLWTVAGVTTVRDLGGPLEDLARRRDSLAAAADGSPRLLVAGPIVTVPDGHPIRIYGPSNRVLTVFGPEDAAAKTAALLDGGADVIKIAVSGRSDTGWPELSDAEIRAIAEAAHARGARVSAHIDRSVALRRAVLAGIDDAAHMPRDRMPDDVIAEMVSRGVGLVPTIDVYENLAEERGNAEEWRATILPLMYDNLRRFVAAGGVLALGDDYGNPRVALGMPMNELSHWIAAGLTPSQVIAAATRGGALVCGLEDKIGLLQPGMAADILVVDGDPLQGLSALERVALVLRDGQVAFER